MTHSISRSTTTSRIAGGSALILLGILVAAPWWATSASLHLIGEFAVYLALATLWNLLAGYTGLVSVGQQAYVGLESQSPRALSLPIRTASPSHRSPEAASPHRRR